MKRNIPKHLLEMYNKACDGVQSPEEKELIQLVLCQSLTRGRCTLHSNTQRSSSGGEPGVFDGSMITCFSLCVHNFPIEHVRFRDTCSNMAAINNNFELFTFMNEFMHDDTEDEFFVPYRNNSILGWDCTM